MASKAEEPYSSFDFIAINLNLNSAFGKVAGHKTKRQNPAVFLHSSHEQPEKGN